MQINDIIVVEISSDLNEASLVYNKISLKSSTLEMLPLHGYHVNSNYEISLPVLGVISVKGLTIDEVKLKIENKLIDEGQLKKPLVDVRLINSKFTILGEVLRPGTYTALERNTNVFQALGYAGDLLITGKKNKITLIREIDNKRSVSYIDLTSSSFINSDEYIIRNNDILIVNANYSKLKSAGFIGNASSIASVASIIFSVTLLILNK
jgi:polysaccharide export outer membrane protein